MLLRFSAENFLCFREENTFSMIASSDDKHPSHVTASARATRPRALRAAAVYGANGHGKTKFVEALMFLKKLVVDGVEPEAKVGVTPFRLDPTCEAKASRFSINFRVGSTDYEYGLVADKDRIHEEWLFGRFNRREQEIFTRKTSSTREEGGAGVSFGRRLKELESPSQKHTMDAYLEFLSVDVRSNQLLVRELADRDIPVAKEVSDWFEDSLIIVPAGSNYSGLHQRAHKDKEFLEELTQFVAKSDIGITKVGVKETKVPVEKLTDFPAMFIESLKDNLDRLDSGKSLAMGTPDGPAIIVRKNDDGEVSFLQLQAEHQRSDGEAVTFDIFEESSGTRRLLDLIPMLSDSRATNRVFVVDELDRKLHPLLAYHFIQQFLACPMGQLIFTTHNTFLLSLELLRRDEIWFSQKRRDGSVEIYSLNDFKVRPDLDIRKGYLFGRFGGIPYLPDDVVSDCLQENDAA